MRIIWIKVGGLFPVNTGGRRRTFETLAALSLRHRVVLLTTDGPGEDPSLLAAALPECEVISVPLAIPKRGSLRFALSLLRSWFSAWPVDLWRCRSRALREQLELQLAKAPVDVCVADFLAAVPNLPERLGPPLLLFEHNVESQIWRRLHDAETRPWARLLLALEWRKLRRVEARACARARRTVAVSETDRAQLSLLAPGADIVAVPTGVDTTYFAPGKLPEWPRELVFTGAMDWFPNEDGILRFLESTLPLIRRALPEVTLTVVGRNPSARLRAAAVAAGALVTGTVDDVRPYLAAAAVCVVPLRIGGGTRLKIFEALAMAKAVVSTTIGAEGLPVVSGKHLLIADEPAPFADAIVGLLRDPTRRAALGAAGRDLVEWQFAWPQVARRFEQQLTEVTGHAS